MINKTAVILSNTGTPDDTSVAAVRRYLKEFLGDARVITMSAVLRKMLVNGIIVPFRAPKSARLYEQVWTPEGSPLLVYSMRLKNKLQEQLGKSYEVIMGMRYGNPSLKDALQEVKEKQFTSVVLLPLFPQYASSTTGTILELVHNEISRWNNIPALQTIPPFFNQDEFIACFAENILNKNPEQFDHILFSYHGLPLKHVNATHQGKDCSRFNCTKELNQANLYCYRAACYATTRRIAASLNLPEDKYTVCFQSRFSQSWLSPFADEEVKAKARQGVKNLLLVSPSFVTDCLETIVELGIEYRHLFEQNGGEKFEWTESLNDGEQWVKFLAELITGKNYLHSQTI